MYRHASQHTTLYQQSLSTLVTILVTNHRGVVHPTTIHPPHDMKSVSKSLREKKRNNAPVSWAHEEVLRELFWSLPSATNITNANRFSRSQPPTTTSDPQRMIRIPYNLFGKNGDLTEHDCFCKGVALLLTAMFLHMDKLYLTVEASKHSPKEDLPDLPPVVPVPQTAVRSVPPDKLRDLNLLNLLKLPEASEPSTCLEPPRLLSLVG